MGSLRVHRDVPGQVRHVGNAMVIFQAHRVAPLFVAKVAHANKQDCAQTLEWMWNNGGNPNSTKASVSGSRHTRQIMVGTDVWFLPPGPILYHSDAMKVKRRRVAKVRHVERRRARAAKLQPVLEHECVSGETR